jgi:hypothetical protein
MKGGGTCNDPGPKVSDHIKTMSTSKIVYQESRVCQAEAQTK